MTLLLTLAALAAVTQNGHEIVPPSPVVFDGSSLALQSAPAVDAVASWLRDTPSVTTLRVEGHVFGAGVAVDQATSEARALVVSRALVARGVDCKRLIAVGFGGSKPMVSNETTEGRATNTRVVFVNAALRGTPIGGLPLDGGGRVAGDPCGG